MTIQEKVDLEAAIENCFVDVIRPQAQLHGGNIQFLTLQDDGVVIVKLEGACRGCPISLYTLKLGVLEELKKITSFVTDVIEEEEL